MSDQVTTDLIAEAFGKADVHLATVHAAEEAQLPRRNPDWYQALGETVPPDEEAEVRRLAAWLADPPPKLRFWPSEALPMVVALDLTIEFRKTLGNTAAVRRRLLELYPFLADPR